MSADSLPEFHKDAAEENMEKAMSSELRERFEEEEGKIPLRGKNGKVIDYAIIDKEFEEEALKKKWHRTAFGHVATNVKLSGGRYSALKLHHAVMGMPPPGMVIDHINRNPLDNRKENLRFVTPSQNCMNKKINGNEKASVFKGVCFHKPSNKWGAYIKKDKEQKHLGLFDSEVEAALAYDNAALDLFGEYSLTNLEYLYQTVSMLESQLEAKSGFEKKYFDLLMCVQYKVPNMTRHESAKAILMKADSGVEAAKQAPHPQRRD